MVIKDKEEFIKRLAACMQIGVRIENDDGHRWLFSQECDRYGSYKNEDGEWNEGGFIAWLRDIKKIYPNCKIYGTLEDALNYVDYLLKKAGARTLLEIYGEDSWWGLDQECFEDEDYWDERTNN